MGGAAASPLAEIERTVQERAKDISLEMAAPGGEAKLRALIADEVARWNDDHRRGRRAFALPDPDLVVERAFRNLARYGPLTPLLADDDVWEMMVVRSEPLCGVSPGPRTAYPLSGILPVRAIDRCCPSEATLRPLFPGSLWHTDGTTPGRGRTAST